MKRSGSGSFVEKSTASNSKSEVLKSSVQTDVDESLRWARSLELAEKVAHRIPQDAGRNFPDVMISLTPDDIQAICKSICDDLDKYLSEEFEKFKIAFTTQQSELFKASTPHPNVMPAKFEVNDMCCGNIADFYRDVYDRLGHPSLRFEWAMKAEHCFKYGSDMMFENPTSKKSTSARREWAITVDSAPLTPDEMKGDRIVKEIKELKETESGKKLSECEIIAIALYTGPMFTVYNTVLRRKPIHVYAMFRNNLFSTTICVLISGVHKLSRTVRLTEGLKIYRGLGGGLRLPSQFIEADEQGCRGIVEADPEQWGFTSITSNWETAVQYSGLQDGKLPKLPALVLEAEIGAVARGASIKELSQYPHEEEFLLPPCSFMEPNGGQRLVPIKERGILTVVPVKLFPNVRTLTIEDLQEQKKKIHVTAFYHMLGQIRQGLEEAAQRRSGSLSKDSLNWINTIERKCMVYYDRHSKVKAIEFADDDMFRALVVEMLHVKSMAAAYFYLCLTDEGTLGKYLQKDQMGRLGFDTLPLNEAYSAMIRIWDDRLPDDQVEGRLAAAELCLQEGLLVKELSEPGIVKACRQGCSIKTLKLLLHAGAQLSDTDWEGNTACHQALDKGHVELLKALLESKADPSARNQVAVFVV